ncbi:hypothetical protein G6L37_06165 [Agrobacterium rubi]|nr:hypothetical protein [Agrobacterium rubi]NTF24946.1 hypothetical protein [Agrobacterium rubi]
MSDPQKIWCQPGDQPRRQFVVIFDDPDQAMAVFDNEVDARDFWSKASTDWNCHLLGALPQEPDSGAAADILDRLEKVAAGQRQYFDRKQTEYPGIEDFLDGEGVFTPPEEIEPLLNAHHYNGRFSEADWWLETIRALATEYPAAVDSHAPVAYACKADIEMLATKPEGHDVSLSPQAKPQYGMKLALYADRDGSRTLILEEMRELRAALRPFAETLERCGDNVEVADSISLAWALQTNKLHMSDVSVGDLRRARTAFVQRPTEIEKITPRPSRPSGELREAVDVIVHELVNARRQDATRDTDTAGRILGQLMLLSERAKR